MGPTSDLDADRHAPVGDSLSTLTAAGCGLPRPAIAAGPDALTAVRGALVRLPAAEFSYIGRPAETFEGRWAAIEEALQARFGDEAFSLVDVGSNNGYFALSAAMRFPRAHVVGVEGSVGIGNGAVGTSTRDASQLIATEGVQKHLQWVGRLGLSNCFVAPEVWDLDRVEGLREAGFRADAMLSLSVVHHIDGICQAAYSRRGLDRVEGSLVLLAGILRLAECHVLELPDRPWLEHLHSDFKTPEGILRAALVRTDEQWGLQMIHRNDWFGVRELWLLERRDRGSGAASQASLRSAFPILLPGDEIGSEGGGWGSAPAPRAAAPEETAEALPGDAAFVSQALLGRWRNAYGSEIEVSGQAPLLKCVYLAAADSDVPRQGCEVRCIAFEEGRWCLDTPAGHFTLRAVGEGRLTWRAQGRGWSTEWLRG